MRLCGDSPTWIWPPWADRAPAGGHIAPTVHLDQLRLKVEFSSNRKKAKARVQPLHAPIGNRRRDYRHEITTTISQHHAVVCIEDLQVRNMSKSAAGTRAAPGNHVKAKSGPNKAILD
jgi:transposase